MNTNTAPKPADVLKQIKRVCTPKPLEGDNLKKFFVETDASRDPHQKTRERMSDALQEGQYVRLLFCGHRGCGKSTELNKFLAEHTGEYLTVQFSVQKEMAPVSINAEDLLLVMTERALKAANDAALNMDDTNLKPVLEYFERTISRRTDGSRAAVAAKAGIGGSVFFKLVDIFATASAEAKYESQSETTTIAELRKRPADLLTNVNGVLEEIQAKLKKQEKRLLFIVEDLDKLDIEQARNLFMKNVSLLTGIHGSIIYTIPIFLFHSPDAGEFMHHFDAVINQRMIQVIDPPDRRGSGFEVVKEIVLGRMETSWIEDAALDRLVQNTAGVLRHVFDVLHYAASKSNASIPLGADDIDYGLNQLSQVIWPQISLPYKPLENGPKSRDELIDRLVQYAMKQMNGEKPPPVSDPVTQLLLKSCSMVEYNGEGWFGVHPLVVSYLKRLGKLS